MFFYYGNIIVSKIIFLRNIAFITKNKQTWKFTKGLINWTMTMTIYVCMNE